MKNIKNLKITTLEGFSVKDLERFPSMEWGEDGGLRAKLLYNGKEVMEVFNQGDGGMAINYWTQYGKSIQNEVLEKALQFLQRVDEDYQQGSEYYHLAAKTPSEISEDDFETIVILIEEQYDKMKEVQKSFKKGYKTIAILSNDYQTSYLQYWVSDITEQEVKQWLVKNNHKEYTKIELVHSQEQLMTM